MKYLFLIFTITFQGQVLHHEMLSSQGISKKMSDGLMISQTIGQQSFIGNFNKNYVVMQGFQQSLWFKHVPSNSLENIKAIIYPNPFVTSVYFKFSKPITETIEVYVFDVLGHLILRKTKKSDNSILIIDMPDIAEGVYFVKLMTKNYSYTGQILKSK
jgi:hypothetical protein